MAKVWVKAKVNAKGSGENKDSVTDSLIADRGPHQRAKYSSQEAKKKQKKEIEG